MICSTCSDILLGVRNPVFTDDECLIFLHHPQASHLIASADEACAFCDPLWNQFSVPKQRSLSDSDKLFADHEFVVDVPDIEAGSAEANKIREDGMENFLSFFVIHPNNDWTGYETGQKHLLSVMITPSRLEKINMPDSLRSSVSLFALYPTGEAGAPQSQSKSKRDTSTARTDSNESWVIAQSWLKQCTESHTTCNRTLGSSWYPTRVLTFQDTGTMVRVMETSTEACNGPYMTLSHRWGSFKPKTLNRDTRQELLQGVQIESLPQAFQDAISICRRLEIHYLWIDCLCIAQDLDDLSDWVREASSMHKVYSNSFLNISSLACPDSSHSLFSLRRNDLIGEIKVQSRLKALHPQKEEELFRVVNCSFWQTEITHAALNVRGWVLQERLLSPRVLHFGRNQLLWECHETDASESYPQSLPQVMTKGKQFRLKNLDPTIVENDVRPSFSHSSPQHAPYQLWCHIVEAYTKCDLTKGSDKLIALSGIAKRMKTELIDDEYVAGMWRRYLASELIWHVDDRSQANGRGSHRPHPFRAPTFSWASVDGIINMEKPSDDRPFIEVIEVNLTHASDDITGLLTGGSLTLRCQLQRLAFRRNPIVPNFYITEINGSDARELEGPEWERMGPMIMLDEHTDHFEPADQEPGSLFCTAAHANSDGSLFQSLLLRLVDATPAPSFARFGVMRSYLKSGKDISPDLSHVRKVMLSRAPDPEKLPCISFDGEHHLIRMI